MAAVDLAGLLAAWLADERNAQLIARTAAEYAPSLLQNKCEEKHDAEPAAGRPEKGLAHFLGSATEADSKQTSMRSAAFRFLSGLDRVGLSLRPFARPGRPRCIRVLRRRAAPQDGEKLLEEARATRTRSLCARQQTLSRTQGRRR